MKPLSILIILFLLMGCKPVYRLVYSNNFSFTNYDFIVIGKPAESTSTSLYGFDVEMANLLTQYGIRVVGSNEINGFPEEKKQRSLYARMSITASEKNINLISISFDDVITDRVMASLTQKAKGDLFDSGDREKALEGLSSALIRAMERDRKLKVTDEK